jgi:tetrahydromethanopterin S-methyltransferase subunit G
MMRFFLLEFVVAIFAFGMAWLVRRILGRLIGGPTVILWGLVLGLIAVTLCGALFAVLGTDFGFINFEGNLWLGARAFFLRFWDTGLIAGALGALVASLMMIRRKQPTPPTPPVPPA